MDVAHSSPTAGQAASRRWLTWLAFAGLVLLGGSNSVAVRFSNMELPPFWGATLRFVPASAFYWAIVLLRRIPLPRGRACVGCSSTAR